MRRGEFVSIFCTGLGAVSNTPATGNEAAADPLSETLVLPTVTVGGVEAPVSFSGLAPGFVGLYQVNVEIPEGVASGDSIEVAITIGGAMSNERRQVKTWSAPCFSAVSALFKPCSAPEWRSFSR